MLVTILKDGKVKPVTAKSHERVFRNWSQGLSSQTFQGICDAVNQYVDREGRGEIVTSSEIPGSDWNGTPYQPILDVVGRDGEATRFFLGLIVWRVMMNRPEMWAVERYPRQIGDVIYLTYFRVSVN